jgi:hypothetical protein
MLIQAYMRHREKRPTRASAADQGVRPTNAFKICPAISVTEFSSPLGPESFILRRMTDARGFKAKYDYVELIVEPRGTRWRLTLTDRRHAEKVEHDEEYDSSEEAREAALTVAQHHINISHNDTLLAGGVLSCQPY